MVEELDEWIVAQLPRRSHLDGRAGFADAGALEIPSADLPSSHGRTLSCSDLSIFGLALSLLVQTLSGLCCSDSRGLRALEDWLGRPAREVPVTRKALRLGLCIHSSRPICSCGREYAMQTCGQSGKWRSNGYGMGLLLAQRP